MRKITIFKHPDYPQVRAMLYSGLPWFLAMDVCKVLNMPGSVYNTCHKYCKDMRQIIGVADEGVEKQYTVISISDVRNLALQAPDQLQASKVYKWLAEHAGLQKIDLIAPTENNALLNQAQAWLEQSRKVHSQFVEEPPKRQKRSAETWVAAQNMYWLKYYFKLTKKFWQALAFVLKGLSATLKHPQRKIGGVDVYHRKVEAELLRKVEIDPTFLQQYRKQSKPKIGDTYEKRSHPQSGLTA